MQHCGNGAVIAFPAIDSSYVERGERNKLGYRNREESRNNKEG